MYMKPNLAYKHTHTRTNIKSMLTKVRLHLALGSVKFQPATTHEAKCLFHDHAGRAGDQKKNYQQPESHTIIHDIILINTEWGKEKNECE